MKKTEQAIVKHIDYMISKYESQSLKAKTSDLFSATKHMVHDLEQIKEEIISEFEKTTKGE